MAIVDIVMPKLGESIMEATILKWHKKPGDTIANDETLLDIATDKVDSEVPSTAAGVVSELLYKENDVVPIGAAIARINTNTDSKVAEVPSQPAEEEEIQIPYVPQPTPVIPKPSNAINRFYSPLVLTIANSEGINMMELETIPGSGNDNRVTKNDILAYIEAKKRNLITQPVKENRPPSQQPQQPQIDKVTPEPSKVQPAAQQQPEMNGKETSPAKKYGDNVDIIEMDRMRKLIAKHMVESKQTSPHVTSFAEADVTNMVLWRNRVKDEFEKREGTKITFTPLFIECII